MLLKAIPAGPLGSYWKTLNIITHITLNIKKSEWNVIYKHSFLL